MIIRCRSGFFLFEETVPGEVSTFASVFKVTLVPYKNFYTFEFLEDAEEYSLLGKPYLNLPALATFEGEPWEVMEENGFVYSLSLGILVPKISILSVIKIARTQTAYIQDGIIQPGSLTPLGERISGYKAWFSFRTNSFQYAEIET